MGVPNPFGLQAWLSDIRRQSGRGSGSADELEGIQVTADYNGWNDLREVEREALDEAEGTSPNNIDVQLSLTPADGTITTLPGQVLWMEPE
jgi:hypothetical protein